MLFDIHEPRYKRRELLLERDGTRVSISTYEGKTFINYDEPATNLLSNIEECVLLGEVDVPDDLAVHVFAIIEAKRELQNHTNAFTSIINIPTDSTGVAIDTQGEKKPSERKRIALTQPTDFRPMCLTPFPVGWEMPKPFTPWQRFVRRLRRWMYNTV